MFSLTVSSHVFIAHSLKGEIFGPAGRLHGATLLMEAEFSREELDENGIVIDVGEASLILRDVGQTMNYQNLDELEVFKGKQTSLEYLAYHIHGDFRKRLAGRFRGMLKITLRESPQAWAGYAAPIDE